MNFTKIKSNCNLTRNFSKLQFLLQNQKSSITIVVTQKCSQLHLIAIVIDPILLYTAKELPNTIPLRVKTRVEGKFAVLENDIPRYSSFFETVLKTSFHSNISLSLYRHHG